MLFVLGICPAPLFALYGQQIKPGGFCFHGQHAMTRTRFVKPALRRCVADWRGVVPSVTLLASSHGSIPSFSTCAQKLCLLAILADPSEVPGYPWVMMKEHEHTLAISFPTRQRMASKWHGNDSSPLVSFWARLAASGPCAAGESRSHMWGDGSGSGFDPRALTETLSFSRRNY